MPRDKMTKEEFTEKLKKLFPKENFEVFDFSNGVKGKVSIKCNLCGSIYTNSRGRNFYSNKYICQKCHTKTRLIANELLKNNNFIVVKNNKRNRDKITIKCKKCEIEFERTYDDIAKSKTKILYCPNCSSRKSHNFINYQERVNANFGNEYILMDEVYYNKKISIKHKNCGLIFEMRIDNFLRSKGCPICAPSVSKGEQKILNYFKDKNYNCNYQFRIPNTKFHFDFLIDNKIVIEYQGLQHYQSVEIFGGEKRFLQQIKYDNFKRNYCKKNNLILLEIPYTDYKKIEEILDSFFAKLNDQSQDVIKN